ncbi:MAG: septation protein SpoVG [Acidobacteria bacterium]|nr:MAG: septation protein SpoVG [Acidobacteriota bacterium]
MEITEVRVFPVEEEKLKAFVSIIIDDCFVVSDIKIISGSNGLFISMPSKKRKNGTFRDIAHPLNNETRRKIEERVLARYREVVAGAGAPEPREDRGAPEAGPDGTRDETPGMPDDPTPA